MAVTREDVLHVAKLARLRLTGEELARMTQQLNSILGHMEELNEADVSGVAAVGGATEWQAPLRAEATAPDSLAAAPESIAPAWQQGFFTVPRLPALDASELDEPFEDKARAEPEGRAGGAQRP
ncbi:MAG: Asp-tRNA(Asn)/Glu-tRNA(Gln) amidotransferase subunit GatC [Gemmatimonadetes bacterium]|nr:Asp-tRNA(Asn)/Glu-tRNA(Gln) amidotransferase subunit GatC [Gemmatimonadota bacterium]